MKKIFLMPFIFIAVIFLSGCSSDITERGHNADWNEGYEAAMIEIQEKENCINSLQNENNDLKQIITSADTALSQATEPGFGYYPPYNDLLDAFEGAKSSISEYSSGIIHDSCR